MALNPPANCEITAAHHKHSAQNLSFVFLVFPSYFTCFLGNSLAGSLERVRFGLLLRGASKFRIRPIARGFRFI